MSSKKKSNKCSVIINPLARRKLKRLPQHILESTRLWIQQINTDGIKKVRKMPVYEDKSVRGSHNGQRYVIFDKSYKIFYEQESEEQIIIVLITEI